LSKTLVALVERKGNLAPSRALVNDYFRFTFERTSAALPASSAFISGEVRFYWNRAPQSTTFFALLRERSSASGAGLLA
jgi:hypothetical protein